MKKSVLVIFTSLVLICAANAFTIKMTNTADKMMVARVHWLSCDWEGFPPVALMFTGEIQPGATSTMAGDYKAGTWSVEWGNDDFGVVYESVVPSDKGILISVPDATPIFHPGT